jgi:ATP-dependent Lon protease
LKRVMLPARNRRDFDDIPEEVRQQLTFTWLERVDDAVSTALESADPSSGVAETHADREAVS